MKFLTILFSKFLAIFLITALTMLVALSSHAYAEDFLLAENSCIDASEVLISSTYSHADPCRIKYPLQLKVTQEYYPKLKGTYTVKYWVGFVARTAYYKRHIRRYITNVCTGQILDTIDRVELSEDPNYFWAEIRNPNLRLEKIEKTYELLPLSEREAQREFEKLVRMCREEGT